GCRKQSSVWSFTMPTACMKEYIIVPPTKVKPSFFNCLLMLSLNAVEAGTSACVFQWFTIGFPSTKRHMYSENVPYSACIFKKAWALVTTLLIFRLFRTIPASLQSLSRSEEHTSELQSRFD